jgi:CDGSH iron-sulfur domain-containing protein 3
MPNSDARTSLIAQRGPYAVEVTAGRKYFWCACGRSQTQPFCDGSHATTDLTPVEFKATETTTLYFCGCKRSGTKPLCDGTHNTLPDLGT